MEINEILTKLKEKLTEAHEREVKTFEAYESTPTSNIPEVAVKFAEYSEANGYHKGIMEATDIILKALGEIEA